VRAWYTGPTLLSLIISATILNHYVQQNEGALKLLGKERKKLKHMADSDPLTGTYNRRYFFDSARHIHKQFRRYSRPYSILMFDMDDFKSVNDRYGHAAGDAVLCEVVQRLKEDIRDVDILARYGGEEFILLMPETRQEHAHRIAERLLTLIGEQPMLIGESAIHVTTSIGVAGILEEGEKLEDVIERSDQALYLAKGQGKNRVILSRVALDGQIPLPFPGKDV
jgi:diguanylate cyclase (GGDEF)-like protein